MARMTCTGCKRTKPSDEFGPDARRASGKRARCRACDAAATKERKARAKRGPAAVLRGPWKPLATVPEPDTPEAMIAQSEADQVALEAVAHARAVAGLGPQAKALEVSLAKLGTDDLDAAAVERARRLARALDAIPFDDPHGLAMLDPKFGAALRALGLTRDGPGRRAAEATAARTKLSRFGDY